MVNTFFSFWFKANLPATGSASDKNRRKVKSGTGKEHSGNNLIAGGEQDHSIKKLGADISFNHICDQLPLRKNKPHSFIGFCHPIAGSRNIEFKSNSSAGIDSIFHILSQEPKMRMTGIKLGKRIHHCHHRLFSQLINIHPGAFENTEPNHRHRDVQILIQFLTFRLFHSSPPDLLEFSRDKSF